MTKALFLDRDGVIHTDKHFLYRIEQVEFTPGIFPLCREAQSLGHSIIVITNQSGIARGMYTEADFEKLMSWMRTRFRDEGVEVAAVYHCSHHPDFTGLCHCRKPKPGLFLQAQQEFDLNMKNSLSLGDKMSDAIAAQRAGVGRNCILKNDVHAFDPDLGFDLITDPRDLIQVPAS